MRSFICGLGIFTLTAIIGCGGSDDSDDELALKHQFDDLSDYHLSDFTLTDDVLYWETRANLEESSPEGDDYQTLFSFDERALDSLDTAQVEKMNTILESSTFERTVCQVYCSSFGVVVTEAGSYAIVDHNDLTELFGEVDTEAELHVVIWLNGYDALSYEQVQGGYRAIGGWDDSCTRAGSNLLFIDRNGVVTVEEKLENESLDVDVCP